MTTHTIVCRSPGCDFDGIPAEIEDPAPTIICASCSTTITDITPPVPDLDPLPDPGPAE